MSKFEINIYIWIHIWNTINSTSLNVKQNNLWNSNPVYNENLWRKDQFTKELICPETYAAAWKRLPTFSNLL